MRSRNRNENTLPPIRQLGLPEHCFTPLQTQMLAYRDRNVLPHFPSQSDDSSSPTMSTESTVRPRSKPGKRRSPASVSSSGPLAKRSCSVSTSNTEDSEERPNTRPHGNPAPRSTRPTSKVVKERQNRGDAAEMLYCVEDVSRLLFELDIIPAEYAKRQTVSNGFKSGLQYDKKTIQHFVLKQWTSDRVAEFKAAEKLDAIDELNTGRPTAAHVDAYKEKYRAIYQASAMDDDVFTDSIFAIDDPNDRCSHKPNSKLCLTHPAGPDAGDWRDCRYARVVARATARYKTEVDTMRARMELR
ncbi:hypothetical protein LTR86_001217 [Recurvomyces mirabilis]|nr:hypothetical protein LTR86_001217 [Recurvomyces mirabilis]